jgi:hypothetical protein
LKLAIVAETMQPGMSISYVARQHGFSPSLVFRWRRLMCQGGKEAVRANDEVALSLIDAWMEDYNTVHPHFRLGYRSPREYIMLLVPTRRVSGLTGSTPLRAIPRTPG